LKGCPSTQNQENRQPGVYLADDLCQTLGHRFILYGLIRRSISGKAIFPWVRTELMNSQEAEQAMPLDRFIAETLDVLGTDADEILVEAATVLRANPGPEEHALVNGFNQQMLKLFTSI
jgi:hypothetical protein